MGLPRIRDGGFYYVLLGCGVTSLYFFLSNYSSPSTLVFSNVSRNYQYGEVCSEWQQALQQADNRNAADEEKQDLYDWNKNNELDSLFQCDESPKYQYVAQRGNYYVMYNFVSARKEFGCTETITLSAPGDYRFLDNVVPLIDRWQGPISIALYAPGHDFYTTIRAIAYLRQCQHSDIKELISFHVFFDMDHFPKIRNGTRLVDSYKDSYNCSLPPPWETENEEDMYKAQNSLLYPINAARNVAKLAAKTYFVFPSDIELYPTRNFTTLFLSFVKKNVYLFTEESRNVFVLPIFEILADQTVPENKTELLSMLQKKTAIVFHQTVCIVCHRVIDSEMWVKSRETNGLNIFTTGKRQGRYIVWEPFYVCTQKEPLWDERFTWEGQGNKMIQAYTMCLMDYDFHVLDNAFLIHKPGVKKKKVQMEKHKTVVAKANRLLKTAALELQEIYGHSYECQTNYRSLFEKPKGKAGVAVKNALAEVNKAPEKTDDSAEDDEAPAVEDKAAVEAVKASAEAVNAPAEDVKKIVPKDNNGANEA